MTVKIEASEKPLGDIFCNKYSFSIPLYQRPYTWDRENAAELLDDINVALGDGSEPISDINPYFMGSIVLIKGNTPESDVVDGQQRLTTLTILLSAFRAAVPPHLKESVTHYLYQPAQLIAGIPNQYRLRQRERDEDFFRDYVQSDGTGGKGINDLISLQSSLLDSDSRRNIQTVAKCLVEELGMMSEERRIRLLQYLIQRCVLVVVTTPGIDSAYRIFSVMNARGKDLGLTDLLKADVIGKIPESERSTYAKIWEGEEQDLGRELFNELFAHIYMIRQQSKAKESLLSEYTKRIKPSDAPKEFIKDTLKPFSDALETIIKADYAGGTDEQKNQINSLFRWLNMIDNIDWRPPAMLYLSKHEHDPNKLVSFLKDLERLAASLFVRRAIVNDRIERYGLVLKAINSGVDMFTPDSPLQLSYNEKEKQEKQETLSILNGAIYQQKRIRLYVMLRLDNAISSSEAIYNHPTLSLEHVLPQSPSSSSQWINDFPDTDEREAWTHRLANLVLLTKRKNSQAQNYDFAVKKAKYFSNTGGGIAGLSITTQVVSELAWTPSVLLQRQQAAMDVLTKLWRLA